MADPNRATWLRPYHFKPGEDNRRNTSGSSKSITTLLREALRKIELCDKPMPKGRTVAEVLAESMLGHAISGNAAYLNQVVDRLEGKIGTSTETSDEAAGRPIFNIVDDGRNPKPSIRSSAETEGVSGEPS